ncbi:MAG: TerB family tellurite resistance protein [Chitinophagaceae bacterium]
MKKLLPAFVLFLCCCVHSQRTYAQSEELEQLILDLEKLAQLKQILSDLKKGYDILFGGYTTIKNIAEGNFNLHKTFLDGLLAVSPAVKNYKRIADIVSYQLQLVKEYKGAINRFREDDNFSIDELTYISTVYAKLVDGSLKNLDALAIVITAGKARMSDDERVNTIDTIYRDMEDKLAFLRWFNNSAAVLSLQRSKDANDVKVSKQLYGAQ